jgi:hypothetical protein
MFSVATDMIGLSSIEVECSQIVHCKSTP